MSSIFDGVTLTTAKTPSGAPFLARLLRASEGGTEWRAAIDRWLADDDISVRQHYRDRLLDSRNSKPAYYELLVRETLRALFGQVQREPSGLPVNGAPDFSVSAGDGQVVIEVATLEEQLSEDEKARNAIAERLKLIHGPWVLFLEWTWSRNAEQVPPKVVEQKVRDYLAGAKAEKHHMDLDLAQNTKLRATVWPGNHADAPIGVISPKRFKEPGVAQIRKVVKTKTSKYGDLKDAGIPFVVALCTDSALIDEESAFDALFGQQTIQVFSDDEYQVHEVASGPLSDSGKLTPKGQNVFFTTLSAAMVIAEVGWQAGHPAVTVVLLPNPWAANPLNWQDKRVATVTFDRSDDKVEFTPPDQIPVLELVES